LRALEETEREGELARELGLSTKDLEAVRDEGELLLLKGIGPHHGHLLRKLGIESISALARADPVELHRELSRERGAATFPALRESMVRVWIAAARRRVGLS
ncbi:MAG: DUF4332 domain-containing protein, partial [Vicinamibacteria bacterium]